MAMAKKKYKLQRVSSIARFLLQFTRSYISRFSHLENFSPNFSSSSFVIHVNLLHPCSFMVYYYHFGVFLYVQVLSNLRVFLKAAEITQNTAAESIKMHCWFLASGKLCVSMISSLKGSISYFPCQF